MKLIRRIKEFPIEFCLLLIFAVQFILVVLSNLLLLDKSVDCDTGKLYSHIVEMWKNGTWCIPGWSYVSTMEWDCTSLLAVPLYGLTGNVFLACGLSNIVLFCLFAYTIFYLFDGKPLRYALLALNLMAVPYAVGMLDYYNMLFFGGAQYSIKVLVPVMLAAVLNHADAYSVMTVRKKWQWGIFAGLYVLLLLLTSTSSGIYVAACGIFPVCAVYTLYKFFRWEKVKLQSIAVGAGTVCCVLLGVVLNMRLMGGARGQSMIFCSVHLGLSNFFSCFLGLFELMGGATTATDLPILSTQGIVVLLKLFVVLVLLGCGVYGAVRCLKKKGNLLLLLLLSVFVWNYFVLNVIYSKAGSATYEYRYHLIGMVPLICVAAIVLWDQYAAYNKGQKRVLFVCGLAVIALLNLFSYKDLFGRGEQNGELKELCEACEELNPEIVYLYDAISEAEICRALDESVPYVWLRTEGDTYVFDYYERYIGQRVQGDNFVIVVDNTRHEWGDICTFYGVDLVRVERVGSRSLYIAR